MKMYLLIYLFLPYACFEYSYPVTPPPAPSLFVPFFTWQWVLAGSSLNIDYKRTFKFNFK